MFRKLTLLFFLLLFSCTLAIADTFVVTSNADSGPGTLREALTKAAANGSAVKDLITFKLQDVSEAGRTIVLATKLPKMTSNLVIDGSTQPGVKFGISDAKVQITFKFVYPDQLTVLSSNGADFLEIYGLWINCDSSGWGGAGIEIDNFNKVIIGAPSKGNIINGANVGIHTGKQCIYQNNNSGTDITGELAAGGNVGISCDDVTVGGSPTTGNIFFQTVVSFANPLGNHLILSYNKFGTNYDGTKRVPLRLFSQITRLTIQGTYSPGNEVPINAIINNNIFVDEYNGILLSVTFLSGQIAIQGNSFNTDPTGTINYLASSTSSASMSDIVLSASADVLIGGEDPTQKNLIAYGSVGIAYDPNGKYTFKRNSIFCTNDITFAGYSDLDKLPQVKITLVLNTKVAGTATANADVELFNADCSCGPPNPKGYFATVKADANGNWAFNGIVNGYVMASATLNKLTGLFTGLNIDDSQIVNKSATCTNKGSITGIKTPFTTGISWYNDQNQVVGNSIDLKDVPPGAYTLKINAGTPCELTKQYQILDKSLVVDISHINIKPASCGSPSGYIWGIRVNVPAILTWHGGNLSGTVYGTEVSNIPAGSYTFTFTALDGSCSQTISPIIVKNIDGPNIDESAKIVQTTPCGQSTGSITNITVTSTNPKYSWKNELGQEVATTKDLIGKPAGRYTLGVTDDTPCGPVYSSAIEIPETNGITLNETLNHKTDASCNKSNGSITGITAPGATKFEWRDANNNLAGSNPDLTNVPAGAYRLIASNNFGCSKTSQVYQVLELPGTAYPNYAVITKNACFGQTNGSVSVIPDAIVKSLRWVNGLGQTINGNQQIDGLAAGTYKLYLTDQNDCESIYGTYTINETPLLQIIPNTEQYTDDRCSLNTGSIKNIQITGGEQPYTYKWYNANNEQIASTATLSGVSAGTYKFEVNDAGGCASANNTYTIAAQSTILQAPIAGNVQLCTPGDAFLTVSGTVPGSTYRLYGSVNSMSPLAEQANGRFKVNATTNTTFYISQVSGSCESSRTEVQVAISLSAINISNTITPNGDGINDYWRIDGMENYPNAMVQVFNRYGQKLFDSKGYHQPFNGTFDGNALPNGTYYYVINLNKNCSLLSGSLTIIR